MTLKNLAEIAGTSVATVSKAFSGSHDISEETRRQIFETAKELGCFEKYYKGPIDRPLIALMFPESESEYYGRQIGLLEREISKRGADAVIVLTRFDQKREAELFSQLVYRMKVDGIVMHGIGNMIKNPDQVPLINCFSTSENKALNSDTFKMDYAGGIDEIVKLIKDYGHTTVGFIGDRYTRGKMKMLKSSLRKHGLNVNEKFMVASDKRFGIAGEDGMRQLSKNGELPNVIVAAYDRIAFGAMREAQRQGLKIPENISFVGIDNISTVNYVSVPLTSLHIHLEDVCRDMIDLLFKRIDNRHYREKRVVTISASIKVRESLLNLNENNLDTDKV